MSSWDGATKTFLKHRSYPLGRVTAYPRMWPTDGFSRAVGFRRAPAHRLRKTGPIIVNNAHAERSVRVGTGLSRDAPKANEVGRFRAPDDPTAAYFRLVPWPVVHPAETVLCSDAQDPSRTGRRKCETIVDAHSDLCRNQTTGGSDASPPAASKCAEQYAVRARGKERKTRSA